MRTVDGYKTKLSHKKLLDNAENLWLDLELNEIRTKEGWWEQWGEFSLYNQLLVRIGFDSDGHLVKCKEGGFSDGGNYPPF